METTAFIEAIRNDIAAELKQEILAELQPEIERRLYANIFEFKEAMQYLKVSDSTLRKMVKEGQVPYFRQRGNIYFRQIELDKNIDSIMYFKTS
ncbi:helix-turn-helix domain-containing protein [Paenibacillus lautus]|uniref:helix-turn-helix domain-containing protein n=1 Tax=Paenibacillus lautus TaxID=1401 RepID=UPI003D296084